VADAITAAGLRVERGRRPVLRDLTFTVPTGEVVGLLGPSGSGKSSLMRAVVGVQIVAAGTISVLGQPAGSPGLRARLGYRAQAPAVYADLTVLENLRYFASVHGAARGRIDAVLEEVDLSSHRHDVVGRLSGGEAARVSLAVALLPRPELLVLDEPTVGLDPILRRDLWTLFRRLADGGATLLVSSHVLDEADRCDRLLLLRDGRLVGEDTPAGLRERTGAADLDEAFLRLLEGAS